MKKTLSVVAVSAMLLTGSACFGADDPSVYVKGSLKYVMPSDPKVEGLKVESDNGYGFGGAVGMRFMEQFRVEAEIATQKTDVDGLYLEGGSGKVIDSGDVRITTYMVNAYFDLPISNGFGLYVTGGLGLGTTTMSLYNIDGDDSGFAWKAGAGMFYAIDSNLFMDLGWEYVSLNDADFDVTVDDIYTNNITAAIRYHF